MKIYLASPYTHPNDKIQEQRFQDVCRASAAYLKQGHIIFSPIAHGHSIAKFGNLPAEHGFWLPLLQSWLEWCDQLWILTLSGWMESKGISWEIAEAKRLQKPVFYMEKTRAKRKSNL